MLVKALCAAKKPPFFTTCVRTLGDKVVGTFGTKKYINLILRGKYMNLCVFLFAPYRAI